MSGKRVLLLSFYYLPDICPGSFRAAALVDALLQKTGDDSVIDVITTMPNRFNTYKAQADPCERHSRLNIYRIHLPGHKNGMIDQSYAFLSFARAVVSKMKTEEYSFVIATSSRLMTAALGAYVSRMQGIGLYLDIRDIFVDTIKDVLSGHGIFLLKPFLSMLESFTIRSASKVNLVSEGFKPYFLKRYPEQHYSFFTNGVDPEFIEASSDGNDKVDAAVTDGSRDVVTVLYAGNIGEGQGLHSILPELALSLQGEVRFRVIGDGGRKVMLEKRLLEAGCTNVEVLPPIQRDRLLVEYRNADVLFLHLNDYAAFKKVLPSKLFEYAAFGQPVWAGVSGYAARFVSEEIENAAVFHPCDVNGAIASFRRLKLSRRNRVSFIRKYSRASIMNAMAADICNVADGNMQNGHC